MALLHVTSPHTRKKLNTNLLMLEVCLAGLPGVLALSIFFGMGIWVNLLAALALSLAFEAGALWLRKRPIKPFLWDGSALVTGFLLGIALPPTAPWWLLAIGVFSAIVVAKHLYGGLGQNPFNPAMIGYVVLLISFPIEMTRWLPPEFLADNNSFHSLSGAFFNFLGHPGVTPSAIPDIDAFTAATGLDALKTARGQSLSPAEALANYPTLSNFGEMLTSAGWFWSNLAFLLGGPYLLWRQHITWHIPAAFLGSLGLCALVGVTIDPMTGGIGFHLFSGASMLGAFFIATDPVSAATSVKGKIIYGTGIGLITYIIRVLGGYPDAVAFAVLLMNICAPTIDYFTRPRTYGHQQAKRGWGKS